MARAQPSSVDKPAVILCKISVNDHGFLTFGESNEYCSFLSV